MPRWIPPLLLALALVGAAGCGEDAPATNLDATAEPTTPPADPARYRADATVLESPDHGPQLCLGGVEESYPPQCGGPAVVGWDWGSVAWAESANGTTWASVHVVGEWDGTSFTLSQPPGPTTGAGAGPAPDFTAPCPEPDGGWAVRDDSRITMADQQAFSEHVNAQPDVAASWVDQSVNPAWTGPGPFGEDVARQLNDPAQTILVVAFTGDLDRHRAELEAMWGGMLCVTQMEHTRSELADVQMRLANDPDLDVLGTATVEMANRVEVFVIAADDATVTLVHDRYGDLVDVRGALQPA
jgi:hypothetical protein